MEKDTKSGKVQGLTERFKKMYNGNGDIIFAPGSTNVCL